MSTPTGNEDSTATNHSSSGGQESQNASTKTANLINEVDSFKELDLFSKVFAVDKKRSTLTTDEIDARKAWNNVRLEFLRKNKQYFYISRVPGVVTTMEEFLSSAIIPPAFSESTGSVSVRSRYDEQRSGRRYPPTIMKWEFSSVMKKNIPSATLDSDMVVNPMMQSAWWNIPCLNEANEEAFLHNHLWEPFVEAGLMFNRAKVEKSVSDVNLSISKISTIVGRPDGVEYAGGSGIKTAMIECKSSHNLLIPNEFNSLQSLYNAAVAQQSRDKSRERSKVWSHVCHPFGQLFGYMLDNGVRFGALCSASKTYFVWFDGEAEAIGIVRITEAYFTSQRDFLLAWASFVQEARLPEYVKEGNVKFSLPEEWFDGTPIKEESETGGRVEIRSGSNGGPGGGPHLDHRGGSNGGEDSEGSAGGGPPAKKRSRTQNSGGKAQSQKKRPHGAGEAELAKTESNVPGVTDDSSPDSVGTAYPIPRLFRRNVAPYDFEENFVPFYDPPNFQIGEVLGRGRNGDVFLSDFNGETVAVKQFDLSKNFDSYKREVEGYKFLKEVWGDLVPEPKFIGASRSGMVRFLGLQKGTEPEDEDDNGEFQKKLKQLRTKYHFRLFDSCYWRNAIYVQGDDKIKKLLVIDLEDWEEIQHTGKPAAETPPQPRH
jgi:hypothetical protein